MSFKSFEEIRAWQEARILKNLIRVYTKKALQQKDWAWIDQISRASISIMANIAEGCDSQTNPEFIGFLGYAKRSAAEVRSLLYIGLDEEYLNMNEFAEATELTKKIGAQLSKLIIFLKNNKKPDFNPYDK